VRGGTFGGGLPGFVPAALKTLLRGG